MIEVKILNNPSEGDLSYFLNVGYTYIVSHRNGDYGGKMYLQRGNVGDEKTAMQWYSDASSALETCKAELSEANALIEKMRTECAELLRVNTTTCNNLDIANRRADDLENQLVALGAHNANLRDQLRKPKKRFLIF